MFTRDQNCQTDSLTVALNLEALAWRKRQFSRSLPLSLFHLGGSQSTPSTPDGCVLCEHPGSRLVGGLVGPSWFCWCCVAGSGCFGCAGPAPSPKIDNCCRIGVEKKHLHHCPAVTSPQSEEIKVRTPSHGNATCGAFFTTTAVTSQHVLFFV